MEINLFATLITIIAGLLTIFQIGKELIKPSQAAKIKQSNKYGDNNYTDNTTTINKTTNTTINTSNSNNNEEYWLLVGLSVLTLLIILSLYQLVYNLIPVVCLILLSITIYRETKFPFEKYQTKIQWFAKNLFFIIMIFILFFTPNSITNTSNQIQTFRFDSFNNVLDSLMFNLNFIKNLFNESHLLAFALIGRILVTFGLLYYLVISSITKKTGHTTNNAKDLIAIILIAIFSIIGSNIEFFWDLSEPFRHNIENWFNPIL